LLVIQYIFRFLADAEKRQKWFNNIGYTGYSINNYKYARICSDHFTQDDYYDTGIPNEIIRLKKTAIPSDDKLLAKYLHKILSCYIFKNQHYTWKIFKKI